MIYHINFEPITLVLGYILSMFCRYFFKLKIAVNKDTHKLAMSRLQSSEK